jgi:hypothetical protein
MESIRDQTEMGGDGADNSQVEVFSLHNCKFLHKY